MIKSHGKCLVAGGYSILYQNNPGIVISSSEFFTGKVKEIKAESESEFWEVEVQTPQFPAQSSYRYQISTNSIQSGLSDLKRIETGHNKYIEAVLEVAFKFFFEFLSKEFESSSKEFTKKKIQILIFETGGFINKKHHLSTFCDLDGRDFFPKFDKKVSKLEKTGLGSSACLVSILCKLLFSYFQKIYPEFLIPEDEAHFLAQIANSKAQEKVGSGFDISNAFYGSNLFYRLPKEKIEYFVNSLYKENFSLYKSIKEINFEELPKCQKITFDRNFVMIEHSKGFDTKVAVKKVLTYLEKENEEKEKFLSKSKKNVLKIFELIKLDLGNSEIINSLQTINKDYRKIMKHLGEKCEVEIEPTFATELLNFLSKFENVLYAIVPGAGGFDSIFCLLKNNKEAFEKEYHQKLAELSNEKQNLFKEVVIN